MNSVQNVGCVWEGPTRRLHSSKLTKLLIILQQFAHRPTVIGRQRDLTPRQIRWKNSNKCSSKNSQADYKQKLQSDSARHQAWHQLTGTHTGLKQPRQTVCSENGGKTNKNRKKASAVGAHDRPTSRDARWQTENTTRTRTPTKTAPEARKTQWAEFVPVADKLPANTLPSPAPLKAAFCVCSDVCCPHHTTRRERLQRGGAFNKLSAAITLFSCSG